MTCAVSRGTGNAAGVYRGEGRKGGKVNRLSRLIWKSILPAAASTVFKLLNLQQQFWLPLGPLPNPFDMPSCTCLHLSLPSPAGNACVRFIYAFINQLTKCEFLQRAEIKRRI